MLPLLLLEVPVSDITQPTFEGIPSPEPRKTSAEHYGRKVMTCSNPECGALNWIDTKVQSELRAATVISKGSQSPEEIKYWQGYTQALKHIKSSLNRKRRKAR